MIRMGRLGWCVAVCLAAAGWSTSRAADAKYLPSDAEIVVTVNVKQILDSDLLKKYKDGVEKAKGLIEQALPPDNPAAKYFKAVD